MGFLEMARYSSYSNNTPITNWNNIPIYLTTILTALFVAGFLFSAVAVAIRSPILFWFIDPTPLEPIWSVWRLFTYVFIGILSFFTPFAIFCFYRWSIGIETHLGRESLAKLLLLLVLTGPGVSALWYWGFGVRYTSFGSYAFTAGLLIAFATLYPNSESWFAIPFKWIALACVGCGSVMLLLALEWVALSRLLASCALGFAYINHAKEAEYDDATPLMSRLGRLLPRKAKFRVLPSPAPVSRKLVEDPDTVEMDMLLDKIAKGGMASLSAKERAKLEKAREALIKKDQR